MNRGQGYVSFQIIILFGYMPWLGLQNHMATLFLVLWRISILFSIVAAPIYIPANRVRGFPFLHTLLGFIQFSSVTQSCPTLCDPMDCSTPGFPVHHQLLELAQTHVRRVGDAIQPYSSFASSASHPQCLLFAYILMIAILTDVG